MMTLMMCRQTQTQAQIQVVCGWGNEHIRLRLRDLSGTARGYLTRAIANVRSLANRLRTEHSGALTKYELTCVCTEALTGFPLQVILPLADMYDRWSKLDVWTSRKDEYAVSASVVRCAAVRRHIRSVPFGRGVGKAAFKAVPNTVEQQSFDHKIVASVLDELVDDVIIIE